MLNGAIDMSKKVSTLAVEWIEIGTAQAAEGSDDSLHPRGGVD